MPDDGVIFISTDDGEQADLKLLMDKAFGAENFVADIIWQKKYAKQSDAQWFSTSHDHIMLHAQNKENWRPNRLERTEDQLTNYGNPDDDPRGLWQSVVYTCNKTRSERPNLYYPVKHPKTGLEIYPSETRVWGYSLEQYQKHSNEGRLWWGKNQEKDKPRLKVFLNEVGKGIVPDTIWLRTEVGDTQDAKRAILRLFGDSAFETSKPPKLIQHMVQIANGADPSSPVLDFFAGSGTTGHAVINLNREDGGDRKYILVEMGEYFDTVLKPRIQKVIYSKDWKDGRPVSREGVSHIFKYLSLESYEDTLNNISLTHEKAGQNALELYGDEYLLRYMLDFETKGSETLLNVGAMSAPFDYGLTLHEDGQTRRMPVDLPETFAYLLGLRVGSRKVYHDGERRYLVYRGATPEPERREVAAIWRDTRGWEAADLERDREFVEREGLAAEADEVFVNGDSFIPQARPLEPVFKRRMLAESASG